MTSIHKIALTLAFSCGPLLAEEPIIDLRTFVNERTHQYSFQGAEKIYVNTPPRTGSTLVYNVLRFLFERNNPRSSDDPALNVIGKFHDPALFDRIAIYVSTLRHPFDAALSFYRVLSNGYGTLLPLSHLDYIVKSQVNAFKYLDALRARGFPCLILRFEEFANDFDSLFRSIEKQFAIVIDPEDREYIKKALAKDNVNKNIEKFPSFAEWDEFTQFRGSHIARGGEIPEEHLCLVKSALLSKLKVHSALFQKWGYTLNP